MTKTYRGSCHCRSICFEADIDLGNGTYRCNCSVCAKTRHWYAVVEPSSFRLLAGDEALWNYRFNGRLVTHFFCMHCGVRPFRCGRMETKESNGDFVAVNLACLDDVEAVELVQAPLHFVDGLHDDWQSAPSEVRHL